MNSEEWDKASDWLFKRLDDPDIREVELAGKAAEKFMKQMVNIAKAGPGPQFAVFRNGKMMDPSEYSMIRCQGFTDLWYLVTNKDVGFARIAGCDATLPVTVNCRN